MTRDPTRLLRVATYNVQKGFGMDLRRDPHRTIEVIAELDCDILAVQEGDRRFGHRAGVFDLAHLTARTGLVQVPVAQRLGKHAHGWHGNLLFCRAAEIGAVHEVALPGAEPRGALQVDLITETAGPLRILTAHLAIQRSARRRQAEILAHLAQSADHPVILMGDLNEWRAPPHETLSALDRVLGLAGLTPSYPAPYPKAPYDRIYVSSALRVVNVAAADSRLARRASDHLPVIADLELQQPIDR